MAFWNKRDREYVERFVEAKVRKEIHGPAVPLSLVLFCVTHQLNRDERDALYESIKYNPILGDNLHYAYEVYDGALTKILEARGRSI